MNRRSVPFLRRVNVSPMARQHSFPRALVPLLMPVYGVLLAFNLSILDFTPYSVKLVFTLVTPAFTVAVPALLVLLLKRMGLVTDVGLNGRKAGYSVYNLDIVSCRSGGVHVV